MSRKQKLGSVFLSTVILLCVFFLVGNPKNAIALTANDYLAPTSLISDRANEDYATVSEIEEKYASNTKLKTFDYATSKNRYAVTDGKGNFLIFQKGTLDSNTSTKRDSSHDTLLGVITPNHTFTELKTPILNSNAEAQKAAVNSTPGVTGDIWSPAMTLNNSAAAVDIQINEVRDLQKQLDAANTLRAQYVATQEDTTEIDAQIATLKAKLDATNKQTHDNAIANEAGYAAKELTQPSPLWCIALGNGWFAALHPDINPSGCLAQIGEQLLKGASWILWFSANLFDKSLDYSLNFRNIVDKIPMVELGWKIFRDISNICFIFILLIIAIGIIVDKSNIGSKSMIAGVLTAALLINFSLFFTKVIIDGSNILALQFYGEIRGDPSQSPTAANGKLGPGISAAFVQALDLTTIYKYGDDKENTTTAGGLTLNTSDPWNIVIVTFGGTVLILVTSFVFLAAAALFIIRSLVLIILMITAPIAYMAQALPNATLKSAASTWWKRLSNECIFAPVYMMMTYVLVSAISSKNIGIGAAVGKGSFASLFAGNADQFGTAFTFFLLIGFMVSTLTVAKSLGATGAATAISYGKIASNATKNWVVRNTAGTVAGQVGSRLANSNMMNKWAGSSVGRVFGGGLALKSVSGLANAKIGGQSYNERIRAKQDAKDATAKAVKDATFREKHVWENDANYKTAREGFDKKQKDRINNVQGVGKNGEPVGFTGFSYASRQATRANRAKAMKSFKDEGDKEEIRKNTKKKSLDSLELFAPEIKNEAERTFKALAGNSNKEFEMNSENIEKMQELWQKNIRDAEITQNGDLVGGDVKTLIDSMKVMTDELKTGHTAAGVAIDPSRAAYNNGQLTIKANELQALKGKVDLHYEKLIDAEKKKEADKSAGLLEELVRQGKQKK